MQSHRTHQQADLLPPPRPVDVTSTLTDDTTGKRGFLPPSDAQVRALLLHLANLLRAPKAGLGPADQPADPRVVGCLTAAADELLDPLLPVAPQLDDRQEVDVAQAHQLVGELRGQLLDNERPGDVRQILARGRAARELAEVLHLLEPARSNDGGSGSSGAGAAAAGTIQGSDAGPADASPPGPCTCGARP